MDPLASFTHATFVPLVGTEFRVRGDGGTLVLTLGATGDTGRPGGGEGRTQFWLHFDGPLDLQLAQGTYEISHDTLGEFMLFLSPKGPADGGMRYEAAFA